MSLRSKRILIASLGLLFALSSLAVAKPNRLVVRERHALVGTYGVGLLLRGADTHKYLIDTTPTDEKAALFGFNVKSLVRIRTSARVEPSSDSEKITIFRGAQGKKPRLFDGKKARIEAHLLRRGSRLRLDRLEIWVYERTQTRVINVGRVSANTQIDITWIAKTLTNPGSVVVAKNGVEVASVSGLKTLGWSVGTVAFGSIAGPVEDFKRAVRLDEYRSIKKIVP